MATFSEIMAENGYTCKTTFWTDFSIANKFGVDAIRDTYNRAFDGWKTDVEYMSELVLVLNHKIWQWYEKDDEFAAVYDELWRTADQYCLDYFKDDDAQYYFDVTD